MHVYWRQTKQMHDWYFFLGGGGRYCFNICPELEKETSNCWLPCIVRWDEPVFHSVPCLISPEICEDLIFFLWQHRMSLLCLQSYWASVSSTGHVLFWVHQDSVPIKQYSGWSYWYNKLIGLTGFRIVTSVNIGKKNLRLLGRMEIFQITEYSGSKGLTRIIKSNSEVCGPYGESFSLISVSTRQILLIMKIYIEWKLHEH